MTVPYDPEKSSILILLAVRGTVVPMVLTRPLFWLLVSMETALLVLKDRYPDDYPDLQYGVIGPLVSLLSFFIVFYGNQCYTRFYKMYDLSKALVGCCQEWATLARTFLPNKGVVRWNATRHIVAALQLEYFSLTSNKVNDDEWEALIEHSLLTKAECDLVGSFKGFKPMLLIGWALKEVEEQLGIGHGRDNKYFGEYNTFLHTAFKMRGACAAIVGTLGQPVPFPYFHLLTFMLSSTCLLVGLVLPSFASDVATSIFCMISYMLFSFVFIGLRALAISLADPFGEDAVDLEVNKFAASARNHVISFLNDTHETSGCAVPEGLKEPPVVPPDLTPLDLKRPRRSILGSRRDTNLGTHFRGDGLDSTMHTIAGMHERSSTTTASRRTLTTSKPLTLNVGGAATPAAPSSFAA